MSNRAPTADLNPGYERAAKNYRQSVLQPTGELLHPTLQRAYYHAVDRCLDFWRPVVASDIDRAGPFVLSIVRAATNAWATGYRDLGPPRLAAEPCVRRARDTFVSEGVAAIDLLTQSVHDPDINLAIEENFVQHANFIMSTIGTHPAYQAEVNGILNGVAVLAEEAMANLETELGPRPGPGWKPSGERQLDRVAQETDGAVRYWVKRLAEGGGGVVWFSGAALGAAGVAQSLQAAVEALL